MSEVDTHERDAVREVDNLIGASEKGLVVVQQLPPFFPTFRRWVSPLTFGWQSLSRFCQRHTRVIVYSGALVTASVLGSIWYSAARRDAQLDEEYLKAQGANVNVADYDYKKRRINTQAQRAAEALIAQKGYSIVYQFFIDDGQSEDIKVRSVGQDSKWSELRLTRKFYYTVGTKTTSKRDERYISCLKAGDKPFSCAFEKSPE